jgi:hypothetical protein
MASDLFYGEIYLTKLKVYPFLVEICVEGTLKMSSFRTLSDFLYSWTWDSNKVTKNGIKYVLRQNSLNIIQGLTFLCWNLYGRYS